MFALPALLILDIGWVGGSGIIKPAHLRGIILTPRLLRERSLLCPLCLVRPEGRPLLLLLRLLPRLLLLWLLPLLLLWWLLPLLMLLRLRLRLSLGSRLRVRRRTHVRFCHRLKSRLGLQLSPNRVSGKPGSRYSGFLREATITNLSPDFLQADPIRSSGEILVSQRWATKDGVATCTSPPFELVQLIQTSDY